MIVLSKVIAFILMNHFTMDTLALDYSLPTIRATGDSPLLDNAHAERTRAIPEMILVQLL